MIGAWHYHEAERLLMVATTKAQLDSERDSALAQAAVHAQLANAAAVIETAYGRMTIPVEDRWNDAMHTRVLGGDPILPGDRYRQR